MDIVKKLRHTKQKHKAGKLSEVIADMRGKKPRILGLAKKYETPFYLLDMPALEKAISEFDSAFKKNIPRSRFFYAVKTNYHPSILKTVVRHGWGLDVSSGRELKLALQAGAKEALFSGPGKTDVELRQAIENHRKVIINIDNFSELERIARLLGGKNIRLRAGVRFFSPLHGSWSKFGIPLKDLAKFWHIAAKIKNLDLQGLQFHSSLNREPDKQTRIIKELGKYLQSHLPKGWRDQIKFIDIGGGYYPDKLDGYYPWSRQYPWTPGGKFVRGDASKITHYITRAATPRQFAGKISSALKKSLPGFRGDIFLEPGRIIATPAMHLVLRVVDVKAGLAITDGGLNMMGWEFGREFYLPIFDLTNFSPREIFFPLYGSLCTPRDFWGYAVFAKKITSGDVIVIPNQGAYRFALAQTFIKPVPRVRILN